MEQKKVEVIKNEHLKALHHKVLELVDEGFEEAVMVESPLPEKVRVMRPEDRRGSESEDSIMAYVPSTGTLLINPDSSSSIMVRSA